MNILWFRNKSKHDVELHDIAADAEVQRLKTKQHAIATKADSDINKLNRLLEANGITFKIYKATGHDR